MWRVHLPSLVLFLRPWKGHFVAWGKYFMHPSPIRHDPKRHTLEARRMWHQGSLCGFLPYFYEEVPGFIG